MLPYLRPFQAEALAALASRDVHLALTAPTGSGKGVILERIARDRRERVLLVSPLIALGRQQAARFRAAGIPCFTAMGRGPDAFGERPLPAPEDRVWILGPESALHPDRVREIADWRPTLLAIDEAHCLREWGEEFRPAYGALPELPARLGVGRTLWMSATFPRDLYADLTRRIGGRWIYQGRFALSPDLRLARTRVPFVDRVEIVRDAILGKSRPGILFAGTRKNAGRYRELLGRTRPFLAYHAGMSDEERRNVEARLAREAVDIPAAAASVAATNAFGMGMDFPQFEWVAVAQTPFSLLGLMQALGRVGRGGRAGEAEIFWAEEDFRIAGFLSGATRAENRAARDLDAVRRYLEGDAAERARILRDEFL